jgi:FxsC-like protein
VLYFFLSYARGDDDVYVKKFFDELSKEVRNLTGDPSDYQVGFLDVRGIPLGSSWSPQLINALSTCRIFISLCSPSYFRRPACGKEWQVFAHRVALHEGQTGIQAPVLMPLIWTPTAAMPEIASRLQWHTESLGEPYRQQGLRQLVRLNRRRHLLQLVSTLAEKIVEAAHTHRLPTPGPLPDFDDIVNAFAVSTGEPAPAGRAGTVGSRHVHFVVAAPSADQARTVRREHACYGERAVDWAPFHPEPRDSLASLARVIAERQRFGSEVGGITELTERIDRANEHNHVVVLLVDAWATRLAEQRKALRDYDQRNEPTTGVLIPMPSSDRETEDKRTELIGELRGTLSNNDIRRDTLFRWGMPTYDAFDLELQDVLEEAQNRIYRRGRAWRLPSGESPGERPILEGP